MTNVVIVGSYYDDNDLVYLCSYNVDGETTVHLTEQELVLLDPNAIQTWES